MFLNLQEMLPTFYHPTARSNSRSHILSQSGLLRFTCIRRIEYASRDQFVVSIIASTVDGYFGVVGVYER